MSRKPRSFDIPGREPAKKVRPAKTARKPRTVPADATLTFASDDLAQRAPVVIDPVAPQPKRHGFPWGGLFWGSLGALASLTIGLWVESLIRDLIVRESWLGWLAIGLTGLIVVSALAIAIREILALRRLAVLDTLRERGLRARVSKDQGEARAIAGEIQTLYKDRPDLTAGQKELSSHHGEIIDPTDLLDLTERNLLTPLDAKARALTMASAKRVSLVTAVSPRALVDVAYVLLENTRLIRRIGELYGARPGTIGFWRLARKVVAHLAVTGTLAVGDGLVQGLVGHGIAAKVSARLGEGVVNGVLTARIGIATMEVCRPLAFSASHRPKVAEFLGELTPWSGEQKV
jgi:putative membrane protein